MLQIRNATISSKKDGRTLADGLSFTLHKGERTAFPGCILSVSHDRQYIRKVTPTVYTLTESGLVPKYR